MDKVDPGDVNIEPAFRVAIYENLLVELAKTKQFKQVFRLGDHNANGPEVLVLKTTVQKYTPGSETRRAVTTVSGATKLNVRSELCTREGKVLIERIVNGNVRFFGGNLRATHNLAHNMAETLKKSDLPANTLAVANRSRSLARSVVKCRVAVTNCRHRVTGRLPTLRRVGTVNAQSGDKHERNTSSCLSSQTR